MSANLKNDFEMDGTSINISNGIEEILEKRDKDGIKIDKITNR